jgi:hypothetical protein
MVEGTVSVNRSSEAANLGMLANLALQSRDYPLALEYANRVLEIDSKSPVAWFCRSFVVGHFSTIENFRVSEMLDGFKTAIESAPEDERPELQDRCAIALNDVCRPLMVQSLAQAANFARVDWTWEAHHGRCMTLIKAFHVSHNWKPDRISLDNILEIANSLVKGTIYPKLNEWTITGKPKEGIRQLEPTAESEMRAYIDAIHLVIQKLDPTLVPPAPIASRPNLTT